MDRNAHIVLLGDSIFDNAAYVGGGPDVVAQLRGALSPNARATLLARDGAVIGDVPRQLARVPTDATLLVMSAGGNDALGESHLLRQPARSVAEAVSLLAEAQERFADQYRAALGKLVEQPIPCAVCTIYDANFPPPEGRIISSALALFNDVITRAAFARGVPLIDLRLICSEPADYANPIEPSVQGGAKIAAAIARLTEGSASGLSVVVAG